MIKIRRINMVQLDMFKNISEVEMILTEIGTIRGTVDKSGDSFSNWRRSLFGKLDKLEKKVERLMEKGNGS
jgi:hypothetical protein